MAEPQWMDKASPASQGRRSLSKHVILKEGYLVKKGHIRHSWRTRWFILKKTSLEYYKRRQDSNPKGQISLLGASLDCPPSTSATKRAWLLKLTTVEGKEYLIEAPDQITRSEWQLAIEERIRNLDPSKLEEKRKSVQERRNITLRRSHCTPQNETEIATQREIVQAMQDRSAGVRLEQKRRGGHVDLYFNGKDAVDWMLTWYFASTRQEAVSLANSMLRNGFFHAIEEGKTFAKSMITADKEKCYEFEDKESARYIFVSYAPVQGVELFPDSDDDLLNIDESSSPELIGAERLLYRPVSTESVDSSGDDNEEQILKQGFLLKEGHLRKSWKIRRFILREKATHLYYYRLVKIQHKPQGTIPLSGCRISTLDDETPYRVSTSSPPTRTRSLPIHLKEETASRPHMFCIETNNGRKYFIQAASDEERNSWISAITRHVEWLAHLELVQNQSVLS